MREEEPKKEYERPTLTHQGEFGRVTAGAVGGRREIGGAWLGL
ncbi:keywimysin-related RiPP [Kribbella sandramycini]|uniref:Lasso RiPP family leader peptide-containing protein n=1 Tax=Kribbella sandramycini TaxID=60450 RepID=A0A841S6F3_9ACTN|nr:keywimysin-related RiPP [Kribbella sandramycini]MBB6564974.1 hypothetical protein [Kribbella sandramycini]